MEKKESTQNGETQENEISSSGSKSVFDVSTIVKELMDRSDQHGAKPEPLWAFLGAWAANIVSWFFFILVGSGPINLLPLIVCLVAVAVSILKIRPVGGKWKYLTIVSLFDSLWMLAWVFI